MQDDKQSAPVPTGQKEPKHAHSWAHLRSESSGEGDARERFEVFFCTADPTHQQRVPAI